MSEKWLSEHSFRFNCNILWEKLNREEWAICIMLLISKDDLKLGGSEPHYCNIDKCLLYVWLGFSQINEVFSFLHNKCTQISFNRFDEFVCHHQLTVDLNHGYFIVKKIL